MDRLAGLILHPRSVHGHMVRFMGLLCLRYTSNAPKNQGRHKIALRIFFSQSNGEFFLGRKIFLFFYFVILHYRGLKTI